ncbi:MAG: hemerythrin domain-containing protein [Betaproteobacteria bacterium]|nr:hemerythrin domain-containing protein [Betaproteobacteria bacterium]
MPNDLRRQVTQAMHEEHMATLDLLGRLEHTVAAGGNTPPDAGEQTTRDLMHALLSNLEHEVTRHFDFEEQRLFPLLDGGGKGELAAILRREHEAIRACTPKLLDMARRALGKGLSARDLDTFRHHATALIKQHQAHMQREESEMIPALEELIDPQNDWELWNGYGSV